MNLLRGTMKLGAPFGIPLTLHPSFGLLMVGAALWGGWQAGAYGALLVTAAMAVLAVSVILHELGHALAARRFGIRTAFITLYPWGGVAAIERMPEEPDQELVIALAGPAVNLVLAAGFGLLAALVGSPVVGVFATLNLGMAVFNLLPAYPMDGGRVLRALLARRMGFVPASRMAHRVGTVFAWSFIAVGVVWPWPSLLLVGAFLLYALRQEHDRLVALHWERTTGRPPPWETTSTSSPLPASLSPWPRSRT